MNIKIRNTVLFVTALLLIALLGCGIYCAQSEQVAYASTPNVNENTTSGFDVDDSCTNIKYIPNFKYFVKDPLHHENGSEGSKNGVCTTVAMQMLLGYHNYHTDRRLIPEISQDGKQFLEENYGDLVYHPNSELKANDSGTRSRLIGTTDDVFDEIRDLSPLEGIDLEQLLPCAKSGLKKFIDRYSSPSCSVSLDYSQYSRSDVKSELDKGNPVAIGRHVKKETGGNDYHVIIAYGYAYRNGEFGYICNFGWYADTAQRWAPESWFKYQVTMNVEHEHNFIDSKENVMYAYRKLECTTCGCTTIDDLYQLSEAGDEIVGLNYEPLENFTFPYKLKGNIITKIGDGVFANCDIVQINDMSHVTHIGANAFKNCNTLQVLDSLGKVKSVGQEAFSGCVSLNKIELNYVNSVGRGAFAGCYNLDITIDENNPYYFVEDNILYNKNQTRIISSGKTPAETHIPDTVIEIEPQAFAGNYNLQELHFSKINPLIGESAFTDCIFLQNMFFYDYNNLSVGLNCFENVSCSAYIPYIAQSMYIQNFESYEINILFIDVTIVFVDDVTVVDSWTSYYGAILSELPILTKTGYTFVGWYDNPDYIGEPWQDGRLLEETESVRLYAKKTPNQYTISFVGEQCDELESITVTYDSPIGELPILQKTGYSFLGWYDFDGQRYDENTVWKQTQDVLLQPVFEANIYQIYFDANDGEIDVESIEAVYDSSIDELATASRIGYEFVEWNTAADGNGDTVVAPFIYTTAGNTTLYAQWQAVNYTIIYNLDGGVQSTSNPNTFTVEDNILFDEPTKTGYTFVCWKLGDNIVTGIEQGTYGDVIVDAYWQANEYSVSFDVVGGSPAIENITVIFDNAFCVEQTPVKEGYDFEGWFDANDVQYALSDGSCTKMWDKAEDAVLYAKWLVKSYEIQINDNGSITWLGANGLSNESCTIEYGTVINSINLIAVFKQSPGGYKVGHVFDHFEYDNRTVDWTSVPDLGENGAVVTIVPIWVKEKHTVYFNTLCTITVDTLSLNYGESIELPSINRPGYAFLGWFTEPTGGERVTWTVMPDLTIDEQNNGSCMLYAQYSLITYKIDYELDGGTNAPTNPTIYNTEQSVALSNATKVGYDFVGWSLNDEIVSVISKGHCGDIRLQAEWTPINYTVAYEPNGGKINGLDSKMPSETFTYDLARNLQQNAYSRVGYTFIGWSTKSNGAKEYDDNQQVVNLSNEASTVTLYAVWRANKYSIRFDSNEGAGYISPQTDCNYDEYVTLNPNSFTKEGYDFAGWSLIKDGDIVIDKNTSTVKNLTTVDGATVTLYAKWTGKYYLVTFDMCGGTGGTHSTSVKFNTTTAKDTVVPPTKDGHLFKGYFSEYDGNGTQYFDDSNPMQMTREWNISHDSTLYACWEKVVYTVTLNHGFTAGLAHQSFTVTYGEDMPLFTKYAPCKKGYKFNGYFSAENGGGKQYYGMIKVNNDEECNVHGYDYYYVEGLKPIGKWDIDANVTLYADWIVLTCSYTYTDMCLDQGKIGTTTIDNLVHGKPVTIKAKSYDGYEFSYFDLITKEIKNSSMSFDVELERSPMDFKVYPVCRFFAVYTKKECVAAGTLITLADGRQVPVETLTGDEELLVWNLYTGQFDTADILFIDKDPSQVYKVINLTFSDGTVVKVISEHAFWDYDLNKYVYLRQNSDEYIGHWFNKQTTDENGVLQSTKVQLIGVEVKEEYTTAYSPVTYGHLCYYVNGMLSLPGGIDGLFNIFEVDPETMSIDNDAMARDVEAYGLYTYEEFAELLPISENAFSAFNGQYLKVAIGKGLIDLGTLEMLVSRYAEFLE